MNFARFGRSSPQNTSAMQRWLDEQNAVDRLGVMGGGARTATSSILPSKNSDKGWNSDFLTNFARMHSQQPVATSVETQPRNTDKGWNSDFVANFAQLQGQPPSVLPPETGPAPAVNEPMVGPTEQPSNPMASMAGLGAMSWFNQPPAEEDQNYIFGQNNPLSAYALSTGMASRMRFR